MIDRAYEDAAALEDAGVREAVERTIALLDRGEVRSAEKRPEGWVVNDWVKKRNTRSGPLPATSHPGREIMAALPFRSESKTEAR